MSYRFVFLDLDDTLLDFGAAERVALTRAYRAFGIAPTEALLSRYRDINQQFWERYERGELSQETLLVARHEQLFREFSISCSGAEVEALYRRYLGLGHDLIEGAEDCLQYLKSRGCRLFVASNGVADTQYSRLKNAGILPYFEDVFISEDVGSNKPEKAFFACCFARIADFDPTQAILIGDSLSSDIRGGKNAGIAACWLNRAGKTAPPELIPDYEICNLRQLQEIL